MIGEPKWVRVAILIGFFVVGLVFGAMLSGCVTAHRTITGESPTGEKYEYEANVTVFGGGGADKVVNAMQGDMKIFHPDGTPKIEVSIDAVQEGTGLSSNPDALLAGIEVLGRMTLP